MTKFNEYPVLSAIPDDYDTVLIYDASSGTVKQISYSTLSYAPVSILGTLTTTNDLPIDATSGDAYIIDDELHIYDSSTWVNVGPFTANAVAEMAANAASSEMNAASSEMNAASSEMNAASSEMNALTSESKAEKWAAALENVEVETNKYSAYHYSIKTTNDKIQTAADVVLTNDYKNSAQISATSAATAATNVGSMLGVNFGNWTIIDGELIVTHLSSTTPSIIDGELILDYETL